MVDAGAFAKSTTPPAGYVGGTYNPVTGETTGGHPSETDMAANRGGATSSITNTVQYKDVGLPKLPSGVNDIPIISTKVNTDAPFFDSSKQEFFNLKANTMNAIIKKQVENPPEGFEYKNVPTYVDDPNKIQFNKSVYQDSKSGSIFVDNQFIPSASMRAAGVNINEAQGKAFDDMYVIGKSQSEQYFSQTPEQKPEEPKPYSWGGMIQDFTKGYGYLKKGDVGNAYELFEQGISRYTTMPIATYTKGMGDAAQKIQIPSVFGNIKTPIGTLQKSVPYGVEQFFQNVGKYPVQDLVLLAIPSGFAGAEAKGAGLRGSATMSGIGSISKVGKLF